MRTNHAAWEGAGPVRNWIHRAWPDCSGSRASGSSGWNCLLCCAMTDSRAACPVGSIHQELPGAAETACPVATRAISPAALTAGNAALHTSPMATMDLTSEAATIRTV